MKSPASQFSYDPNACWSQDEDWSDQIQELKEYFYGIYLKEKYNSTKSKRKQKRGKHFICSFFKNLSLKNRDISKLDVHTLKFKNLEELDIGSNKIVVLENLPPSLQVLNAYDNRIDGYVLHPSLSHIPRLLHLGLGYNKIGYVSCIDVFSKTLISLDISYNSISDLENCCRTLQSFKVLRHLHILGNPMCLLPFCGAYVVSKLPKLTLLDNVETSNIPTDALQPSFVPQEADLRVVISTVSGLEALPKVKTEDLDDSYESEEVSYDYFIEYRLPDPPEIPTCPERTEGTNLETHTSSDVPVELADVQLPSSDVSSPPPEVPHSDVPTSDASPTSGAPPTSDGPPTSDTPPGNITEERSASICHQTSLFSDGQEDMENIEVNHCNEIKFVPTVRWRNVLLLLGIHFVLYERKTVTRVLKSSEDEQQNNAVGGSAEEDSPQNPAPKIETETSEVVLGFGKVDTSSFLSFCGQGDEHNIETSIRLTRPVPGSDWNPRNEWNLQSLTAMSWKCSDRNSTEKLDATACVNTEDTKPSEDTGPSESEAEKSPESVDNERPDMKISVGIRLTLNLNGGALLTENEENVQRD